MAMKHTLIIICCFAALSSNAQNSTDYYGEARKVRIHERTSQVVNEFDNITMEQHERSVNFGDIPVMSKKIYAVLTNSDGEVLKQKRISSENNVFYTGELEKGLYFVTITYRNESKKAFMLKQD